jgi:hypothetical protein
MGLHGWEKDSVPDYTTSVALNEDTDYGGFTVDNYQQRRCFFLGEA